MLYKPLIILVVISIGIIVLAILQWPYFGLIGGFISVIIGGMAAFILAIKGVI